ncbi:MAG: HTTM domain-containing protein [Polyangiales bacterium]
MRLARARARLSEPVDAASLGAFRALLGVVLLVSIVRALDKGVVAQGFVAPTFFFPYYGLGWLPAPGTFAYVVYGALAILGVCLTLGVYARVAAALFGLGFSYLHFVDVTHYLNHYYLVALLLLLLAALPTGRALALWPRGGADVAPAWVLLVLRAQVGLVYFFGGIAKLKHDWLVWGEPLGTWLAASTEIPLVGPLFALQRAPLAMSWLGAAYDLSIPLWLSLRRTRPYAYAAVVVFHVLTARLFNIGIFPYLMMAGSTLFFAPAWPRRLLGTRPAQPAAVVPLSRAWAAALACYLGLQVVVPLRHLAYPGNVLWTEQGYRFAWHVMLIEKTGSAEFRLVDRASGATWTVFPRAILTRAQDKAMATQPDMILAFAHELARRERAKGRDVAVYADVWVTLNGRAPARLIDPNVDLALERDGFAPKRWITVGP